MSAGCCLGSRSYAEQGFDPSPSPAEAGVAELQAVVDVEEFFFVGPIAGGEQEEHAFFFAVDQQDFGIEEAAADGLGAGR